jgi:hypothetical protein
MDEVGRQHNMSQFDELRDLYGHKVLKRLSHYTEYKAGKGKREMHTEFL